MTLTGSLRADLAAGRGRAWPWVVGAAPAGWEREVDRVCLHACGYDSQVEERRAEWLYALARRTGRLDAIRPRLLRSLRRTSPQAFAWTLLQRLELAALDAAAARTESRQAVLDFFARNVLEFAGHANQALLWAAGAEGLAWAVRGLVRAQRLDGWYDLQWLFEQAVECLGRRTTDSVLRRLETEVSGLRRLRQQLARRGIRVVGATPSRLQQRWSWREVGLVLEGARPASSWAISRWARTAPARWIARLDGRIAVESDLGTLRRLFAVFRSRPMVRGLDRALGLAANPTSAAQTDVLPALAATRDRRAHAIAVRHLRNGPARVLADSIQILVAQRRPDDGRVLADRLARPIPRQHVHWVAWCLLDWCRRARAPERAAILTWIWDHTPCSDCRERALRMLLRRAAVPPRILREARHDASPTVRGLAVRAAARPGPG